MIYIVRVGVDLWKKVHLSQGCDALNSPIYKKYCNFALNFLMNLHYHFYILIVIMALDIKTYIHIRILEVVERSTTL